MLLRKMLEVFDRGDELKVLLHKNPQGPSGVRDGKKSNVMDDIYIFDQVWEDLDEFTIEILWSKTYFMPTRSEAQFNNTHTKPSSDGDDTQVKTYIAKLVKIRDIEL